jgi:hypothetical protein
MGADMANEFQWSAIALPMDSELGDEMGSDPYFNNEFQRWFGNNTWSADIL